VTLRQAALAFARLHPAVATLVLGAVAPDEVAANAADAAVMVPAALWRDLKAAGLLDVAAPTD
jgi:D-threo-aldose 1-dehydrogenase